jgi:hypothetical protein
MLKTANDIVFKAQIADVLAILIPQPLVVDKQWNNLVFKCTITCYGKLIICGR